MSYRNVSRWIRLFVLPVLAVGPLAPAPGTLGQELIVNGGFDGTISGWNGSSSLSWWRFNDAFGDLSSGSARAACNPNPFPLPPSNTCKPGFQCITLPANHPAYMRIEGYGLLAVGDRNPFLGWELYDGVPDCSGEARDSGSVSLPGPEGWNFGTGDVGMVPGDRSLRLSLGARARDVSVVVHWDEISATFRSVDLELVAAAGVQGGGVLIPGEIVELDLTLTNLDTLYGSSSPQTSVLFDPRLDFIASSGCPGSVEVLGANALLWTTPDLPASGSSLCTLELQVAAGVTPGDAVFYLGTQQAFPDREPSNDSLSLTIPIDPFIDLFLDLAPNPSAVAPGASFDLETRVRNLGSRTATAVTTLLTLPSGVSFTNGGDCPGVISGGGQVTIRWNDVVGGATRDCILQLAADAGAAVGDVTLDGTTTASNIGFEANPLNNAKSTTLSILNNAFNVTDYVDRVDVNPGDGVCASSQGTCTLRAAIMEANAVPGDAVIGVLAILGNSYDLTLTSGPTDESQGDLDVTDDVRILGFPIFAASGLVPVNGLPGPTTDRIFHIQNGAEVEMTFFLLEGGEVSGLGGGIYVESGTLRIEDSKIRLNQASSGGGLASMGDVFAERTLFQGNSATGGGALWTGSGTVTELTDSTLHDNFGDSVGGGGVAGGVLRLINSTVSTNEADDLGGGLYVGAAGDLDLFNSTIVYNEVGAGDPSSGLGGGIYVVNGGQASLRNSIVSSNLAQIDAMGNPLSAVCLGAVSSDGHNVIFPDVSTTCGLAPGASDIVAEARLDPLDTHGGTVLHHALRIGSPGVDHGEGASCQVPGVGDIPFDQAGNPRPWDGNGDGVAICDAGSSELQELPLFVNGFETGDTSRWSLTVEQ